MVAPLLKLLRRYPPVRNAQLVRAGARRADVVRAVVPLLLGLRPIDKPRVCERASDAQRSDLVAPHG